MKARQRKLGKLNSSSSTLNNGTSVRDETEFNPAVTTKSPLSNSQMNTQATPENKVILGPITKLIDNDTKKQNQPMQGRKSRIGSRNTRNSIKKLEKNLTTPGNYSKEQQLGELIKMFNFDISNERIKVEENTEYYTMRMEIIDLQNKIQQANKEFDFLCDQQQIKNENDNKQIEFLENVLKEKVEENVEIVKADNKIILDEITSLERKLYSLKSIVEKEEQDFNKLSIEFTNTNLRLKNEIDLVTKFKKTIDEGKHLNI